MTTAPKLDQRRLLDLQALDTRLAKLAHARRTHPTIAALAELEGRAADLGRAELLAQTALKDVRRELTKAEDDVAQVKQRAARDQARLDAGQFTAKNAEAVIAELEALARRANALEDIELEVMERLEAVEAELGAIVAQKSALTADVEHVAAERDAALAELDRQHAELAGRRTVVADGLEAGLLALYEKVRTLNSGLAVLGIRGATTEPLRLDLSLSELAAIKAAGPDELVRSEEDGYILVRLDD